MNASEGVTEDAVEKTLVRLRDASLFLVKSDGVALAALGTLGSVFKVEGRQALEVAAYLIWVLQGLGFLLSVSLIVWAFFVILSVSSSVKANTLILRLSTFLFGSLVLAHTLSVAYALGHITSFLENLPLI